MSDDIVLKRHWFRFTVMNMLMITLGIALGFLPLRLWELRARPEPQVVIQLCVANVKREALPALGIEPVDRQSTIVDKKASAETIRRRLMSLENKGQVKILAYPTLTTVSGTEAFFHSGGEIPYLVDQGNGNVSVEFRPFGTIAKVLPTILRNRRIRLAISHQASEIDRANSVEVGGQTVPGLRSRKFESEIETSDGGTVVLCDDASPSSKEPWETLLVATVNCEQR